MISHSTRKGFTLIEMLIVIAIIGILASIVLVGLGPIQRQARDSRRISDLRSVQTLLEICYTRNGQYPNSANYATLATALVGTGAPPAGCGTPAPARVVPNDPNAGGTYLYGQTGGTSYTLGATLEDIGNNALDTDIDGTVNGVNCGVAGPTDSVYCVGF